MKAKCRMIPWPLVFDGGEFAICKGCRDMHRSTLSLALDLALRGRVYIFVGEYVGPEVHTVAALQRKKGEVPPSCTRSLMSLHSGSESEPCLRPSIALTDIVALAKGAGYKMSTDQLTLCEEVLKHDSSFLHCRAALGASKSFCGTMYSCS